MAITKATLRKLSPPVSLGRIGKKNIVNRCGINIPFKTKKHLPQSKVITIKKMVK